MASSCSRKRVMLGKLRATDFCGYEKLKMRLDGQGLVWIAGENRDTRAADSNGCGKTTLFKAVSWVLYGKTIDGARGSDPGDTVIRRGAKRAAVELELDGWRIKRERAKGSPRLALVQPDGKPWDGGGREEVQAKIIEMVGMDFHAFKNTILFGQNDTARFAHPDTTDAQRKDMLHKLLRTDVLMVCEKVARAKHKDAKQRHEAARGELERLVGRMSEMDVGVLERKMALWESERVERADALKAQAATLVAEAKAVATAAGGLDALRSRLGEVQEALDVAEANTELNAPAEAEEASAREQERELERDIERAVSDRAKAKAALESLKGERCEVCDASLSSGAPAARIAHLRGEKAKAEAARDALTAKLATATAAVKKAQEGVQAYRRANALVREHSRELGELKEQIADAKAATEKSKAIAQRARDRLKQRDEVMAEINPHAEAHAAAVEKRAGMEAERSAISARCDVEQAAVREADFWVRGFGPQGLPSFVLDSVVPYITERSNHYLEMLSDGDIVVEYKTQRELKSDKAALRDEIGITWIIEGVENMPPSGGQARKMEIATDLALMDLAEAREGAGLSLFMADEILDGLDNEGIERVMLLLQELRARRSSVFVISHRPSMHELFEKQLTVIKDGMVSRLEGA